jgi:hypothetical protein
MSYPAPYGREPSGSSGHRGAQSRVASNGATAGQGTDGAALIRTETDEA